MESCNTYVQLHVAPKLKSLRSKAQKNSTLTCLCNPERIWLAINLFAKLLPTWYHLALTARISVNYFHQDWKFDGIAELLKWKTFYGYWHDEIRANEYDCLYCNAIVWFSWLQSRAMQLLASNEFPRFCFASFFIFSLSDRQPDGARCPFMCILTVQHLCFCQFIFPLSATLRHCAPVRHASERRAFLGCR